MKNKVLQKVFRLAPPIVLLSAFLTFFKMATNLFIGKIIAVYSGSVGIGLLGQLTNFINLLIILCLGFSNIGLSKLISEYAEDKQKIRHLVNSAALTYLSITTLMVLILVALSSIISPIIFIVSEHTHLMYVLAFSLFAHIMGYFLVALVNGRKDTSSFFTVSLLNSLSFFLVVGLLTYFYSTYGALLGYIIYPIVAALTALIALRKKEWIAYLSLKTADFSLEPLKKLKGFIATTAIVSITVPLSQLLIRTYINQSSIEEAGYWESLNRISFTINLLVGSSLQVYMVNYLGTLDVPAYVAQIKNLALKILGAVSLFCILLYCVRYAFVSALFANSFLVIAPFLKFYFIGDVFRNVGWVLSYSMMIKNKVRNFIIVELLIGGGFFVGISVALYSRLQLFGTSIAYMVFGIAYFVFSLIFFTVSFRKNGAPKIDIG